MALWLCSLFVHENGRKCFYGYDHSHDDLYAFLLYGGIFAAIVALLQGS